MRFPRVAVGPKIPAFDSYPCSSAVPLEPAYVSRPSQLLCSSRSTVRFQLCMYASFQSCGYEIATRLDGNVTSCGGGYGNGNGLLPRKGSSNGPGGGVTVM